MARVGVEPCPCCGSENLYAGIMSADTAGIQCRDCRLKMEREKKHVRREKDETFESWIRRCELKTVGIAALAWNTRPKEK